MSTTETPSSEKRGLFGSGKQDAPKSSSTLFDLATFIGLVLFTGTAFSYYVKIDDGYDIGDPPLYTLLIAVAAFVTCVWVSHTYINASKTKYFRYFMTMVQIVATAAAVHNYTVLNTGIEPGAPDLLYRTSILVLFGAVTLFNILYIIDVVNHKKT